MTDVQDPTSGLAEPGDDRGNEPTFMVPTGASEYVPGELIIRVHPEPLRQHLADDERTPSGGSAFPKR